MPATARVAIGILRFDEEEPKDMRELARRIVHARRFEYLLIILIIGSAVLLGLATSDYLYDRLEIWMGLFVLLALTTLVTDNARFGSASQDVCALAKG